MSYDRDGGDTMTGARLMTGGTGILAALLVAACGSSGPAATASGTPSAPALSPAPSLAASGPASAPPSAPATAAAPPGTVSPACAALAAHTFLHVTTVQAGTDGALTLTGNPATLVCGGADDLHYDFTSATVTGHVIPGASITVFPIPAMRSVAIGPRRLASYLATDEDTRIFLVTGPLSRITGLAEMYHP
jgi:hypothetical protein